MSFEDDLKKAIEEGGREREDFDANWSQLKKEIFAIFKRAEPLFENKWINGGEAKILNGAVALRAARGEYGHFLHELVFTPDKEALEFPAQ